MPGHAPWLVSWGPSAYSVCWGAEPTREFRRVIPEAHPRVVWGAMFQGGMGGAAALLWAETVLTLGGAGAPHQTLKFLQPK